MSEPNLEILAIGAYEAFRIVAADRRGPLPPWGEISPEDREEWRAVADAVRMLLEVRP